MLQLERFPKVLERPRRDSDIDSYLALGRRQLVRLLKLFIERLDSLFEIPDMFAQSPLHQCNSTVKRGKGLRGSGIVRSCPLFCAFHLMARVTLIDSQTTKPMPYLWNLGRSQGCNLRPCYIPLTSECPRATRTPRTGGVFASGRSLIVWRKLESSFPRQTDELPPGADTVTVGKSLPISR